MDIPDIEFVVQFGVPSSLSIWMQRAGRAGRSPHLESTAILLVEKSVLQRVGRARKLESADVDELSPSSGEEEPDGEAIQPKFRKTVEDGLRQWIETGGCRRDIVDKYFNNPSPRKRTFRRPPCSHTAPAHLYL